MLEHKKPSIKWRFFKLRSHLFSLARNINRLKLVFICLCLTYVLSIVNVSYSVRHSEGQFKPWKYINNIFKPEVKGTQSNSESTNQSLAEKNTSGIFTPAQGETEITEKREENFKTFDQGDGKFRVAGSMGPIHYKIDPFNEAEQYKEINLNIKPHTKTDSDTWYNR